MPDTDGGVPQGHGRDVAGGGLGDSEGRGDAETRRHGEGGRAATGSLGDREIGRLGRVREYAGDGGQRQTKPRRRFAQIDRDIEVGPVRGHTKRVNDHALDALGNELPHG